MQQPPKKKMEDMGSEDEETELQRVAKFSLQSLSAVMNDPSQRSSSASRAAPTTHSRTSSSTLSSSALETAKELELYIAEVNELQEQFQRGHAPTEEEEDGRGPAVPIEAVHGMQHHIQTVPKVYFQEDFSLSDPETFEQTCHALGSSSPVLLQEKLSHYLDVVEVELVRQVSMRSGSFFTALTTLQDLHHEVASTCTAISSVRHSLGTVSDAQAKKALNIVALRRRRQNCIVVYKKLKLIARVRAAQPTIQLLLSNSDFAGALDLIATTQAILASDLQGIQSFKHTSLQLKEMTTLIQRMIQDDFLRFALGKTSEITEAAEAWAALGGEHEGDEAEKERLFHEVGLEERLSPLAFGLLRLGKIRQAFQLYREKMQKKVSSTIDRYVENFFRPPGPASAGMVVDEISVLLANLESSTFLVAFLQPLFAQVQLRLERMAYIHAILLPVLDSCVGKQEQNFGAATRPLSRSDGTGGGGGDGGGGAADKGASGKWWGRARITISDEYRNQILFDSSETLSSIVEISHSRCARLLKMRSEANARLSATEFVDMYNVAMHFVQQGEKLCKKQCFSLRNTLLSQARVFLDGFHNNRISSMAIILESETWTQAQVAHEFQQIATDIATPVGDDALQGLAARNKRSTDQRLQQMSEKVRRAHEQQQQQQRGDIERRNELRRSSGDAATPQPPPAAEPTAPKKVSGATNVNSNGGGGEGSLSAAADRLSSTLSSAAMTFLTSGASSTSPSGSLSSSPTSGSPLTMGETLFNKLNFRKRTPQNPAQLADNSPKAGSSNGSSGAESEEPATTTTTTTSTTAPAGDTSAAASASSSAAAARRASRTESVAEGQGDSVSEALVIGERKFHVVNAALILVKLVGEYLNCLSLIPSLSTDVLQKVVELLSLFNSRTCGLVLGAGAMQAASLKSITAKHLSLAAESVGVEVALIPHIKARIGQYLTLKKHHILLNDLDRVLGDCKEHRQEIFTKVVMIMKDRAEVHSQGIARHYTTNIAKSTSAYMLTLIKETSTLYRVLSKILPASEIKHIFTAIFDMFNSRFTQQFNSLESLTPAGKKRLYGDIEYLLQALRGLSSELDPGTKLITLYTSRFGQPPPQQQKQPPAAATQT